MAKKKAAKKEAPKKVEVSNTKPEEVKEEVIVEVAPVEAEAETKPVEEGEEAVTLHYDGDLVISVEDKIVHGNLWKEVRCIKATYLLSTEEFEKKVK